MQKAAKELDVEAKTLGQETQKLLSNLSWPGNVRQLENVCRWLTVMASSQEVLPNDLPPEIAEDSIATRESEPTGDWQSMLASWADKQLQAGRKNILEEGDYFSASHGESSSLLKGYSVSLVSFCVSAVCLCQSVCHTPTRTVLLAFSLQLYYCFPRRKLIN